MIPRNDAGNDAVDNVHHVSLLTAFGLFVPVLVILVILLLRDASGVTHNGDEALKRLVTLVSGRARKLDVLFRVGGEEFMILLPGTRYAGALAAAENLRLLVAHSTLIDGHRMSVSIGVSELQMGQSVGSWIEDADVAVYRAKQGGRNRVRMSGRMPVLPSSQLHH